MINSYGAAASPEPALALGPTADIFSFHIEGVSPAVYYYLMRPLKASATPGRGVHPRRAAKQVYIACPASRKYLPEFAERRDYLEEPGGVQGRLPCRSRQPVYRDVNDYDLSVARVPGRCRQEVAADLIIDADGSVPRAKRFPE